MNVRLKRTATLSLVFLLVGGTAATQATAAPVAQDPVTATPTDAEGGSLVEPTVSAGEGADEGVVSPFAAAGTNYGGPIDRKWIMQRANDWLHRNVPYSQSATAWDINKGKKYRTDCSGFVSMAWALTSSRTTSTLGSVSKSLNWNQLASGDILLKAGTHTYMFEKWVNASTKADFWIIEEGSTASDMNHRKVNVQASRNAGYKPRRYKNFR
jgi:hypothetical protein